MTSLKCIPVFICLLTSPVLAQDAPCTGGSTCTPPADLKDMVSALKEQRCLKTTQPQFQLDPINIIVDKDGRIFVSGAEPRPYTLKMSWCSYGATATGTVNVEAARAVPPTYGFRLRPKATLGFLVPDTFKQDPWSKGLDGGLLIEPFFFQSLNINAYVGVRSVGGGLGLDVTKNFGVILGGTATWDGWRPNLMTGAYFSFW